jgi:transposase
LAKRYTRPYFEVVRARMILLAADGHGNEEIGRRLDLPRQVVSKWRKRFFFRRLEGLQDRPRPGRPRQSEASGDDRPSGNMSPN